MSADIPQADDLRMDAGALVGAVLGRWLRILVVTAVLAGATFAILLFVPKLYESSASILVEQRDNAFTGPATGSSSGSAITIDALVSSQIELIKSRDTLLRVVDTLNLRAVPEFNGAGPNPFNLVFQLIGRKPEAKSVDDMVLQNLNDRLTVIRERDSAIISIFVRSQSPQLAADIANGIAAEHLKRRADQTLQDTAEASTWLAGEIAKLRQRVADAETAVAKFRSENDLFDGTNNTSLLDQQMSNLATQITSAQERRNAARSRATLIRGMVNAGQPIDGLADVQNSAAIQQLSQSKADLQGQLAQRSSTLLPNHPTIKALTAQIREIERQIVQEGRRVASSLEAEADIESSLEASLQAELDRLKQSASSAATHTVALDELQREAKSQRDLLESYLARYRIAASQSDSASALPDVRIVTSAAPSASPASPKTALTLGAVAFAALALQIGAVVFSELLSGRAVIGGRTTSGVARAHEPPMAVAEPDAAVPDEVAVVASVPPAEEGLGASDEPVAPAASPEDPAFNPEPEIVPAAAASGAPSGADYAGEDPDASGHQYGYDDDTDDDTVVSAPAVLPRSGTGQRGQPSALSTLSADIALGRVRIVMIAGIDSAMDCLPVADTLATQALKAGLSVARVDAGSGQTSTDPGITDLAADRASFGDVVYKGEREGLARVPWGNQPTLDRRSNRPRTLVEALSDLYEVVIVVTGQVGLSSALPEFEGLSARLVLAAAPRVDDDHVEAALAEANALGFRQGQVVVAPLRHAEVA